jgi:endonuclease YncB( thermonuclease family)
MAGPTVTVMGRDASLSLVRLLSVCNSYSRLVATDPAASAWLRSPRGPWPIRWRVPECEPRLERVRRALALTVAAAGLLCPPAAAQAPTAMVTRVVDGDTLDAQLNNASVVRVQLIGIDAPEPGDCGGEDATVYLEQLALGRNVTLVNDPSLEDFESPGARPLFYVDRDDGRDLGLEMVRAGWADIWFLSDFQRSSAYLPAAAEAERARNAVWGRCGGDFHLNVAEERRASAKLFMDVYYARVSGRRFRAAWGMLGRRVRRAFGSFQTWKAGYRRSLGVSLPGVRGRLSGSRAVVNVRLRSRDRDACSGRIIRQTFRGSWVLAPRRGSWVAVRARIRKTGGGRVRLSKSECAPRRPPSPRPPPPPPRRDCQGYSPCLTPGPDVDCAGGSGDGPRYVRGPVYVNGSDPYDLDDGDGVGCED